MDFHEIWYTSIFRKSVEKILFSLKYDENKVAGTIPDGVIGMFH